MVLFSSFMFKENTTIGIGYRAKSRELRGSCEYRGSSESGSSTGSIASRSSYRTCNRYVLPKSHRDSSVGRGMGILRAALPSPRFHQIAKEKESQILVDTQRRTSTMTMVGVEEVKIPTSLLKVAEQRIFQAVQRFHGSAYRIEADNMVNVLQGEFPLSRTEIEGFEAMDVYKETSAAASPFENIPKESGSTLLRGGAKEHTMRRVVKDKTIDDVVFDGSKLASLTETERDDEKLQQTVDETRRYDLDYRNPKHSLISAEKCFHDHCHIHYLSKVGMRKFPKPGRDIFQCELPWFRCCSDVCEAHLWDKRERQCFPGREDPAEIFQMKRLWGSSCKQDKWQTCLSKRCSTHYTQKKRHGFTSDS